MCQVPARTWRTAFKPARVLFGVLAVVAAVVSALVAHGVAVVLIGLALALVLAAVSLPVVRELEFGIPAGIRVVTASRSDVLHGAFDEQKDELAYLVNLLVGDPVAAAGLVKTAWSQAVRLWRGPTGPDFRRFVLCTLVHLIEKQEQFGVAPAVTAASNPLLSVAVRDRTVLVLHEFAEMSVTEIAAMTERSVAEVTAALSAGTAAVAAAGTPGGSHG